MEGKAVRRGTRRRNHSPRSLHTYVDVAVALASGGGVWGWDGMGWDGMGSDEWDRMGGPIGWGQALDLCGSINSYIFHARYGCGTSVFKHALAHSIGLTGFIAGSRREGKGDLAPELLEEITSVHLLRPTLRSTLLLTDQAFVS